MIWRFVPCYCEFWYNGMEVGTMLGEILIQWYGGLYHFRGVLVQWYGGLVPCLGSFDTMV